MQLSEIKLPLEFTAEEYLKTQFINLMMSIAFDHTMDRSGRFTNATVDNMWFAYKRGAQKTVDLMESRIQFAADQRVLMEARIKVLEEQIASI